MNQKERTTFIVASDDGVIGWDVETIFNVLPKIHEARERLLEIVGRNGIERFLDYALEKNQILEVSIADEYTAKHSLSFDPFSAPEGDKHDTVFVLFMTMLETCLEEYEQKTRRSNEERAAS